MSWSSLGPNAGVGDPGRKTILEVRDLKKYYDLGGGFLDKLLGERGDVKAVDGVDLDIYEGEILAVVGESGCGKSTLAKTILNLEDPSGGSVTYRDDDITGLEPKEMRPYRKEMQMIFQDPAGSLNPRKTVGTILTTPLKVHGIGDGKKEREEIAKSALEDAGLEPSHFNRYPRQFSGGQQQRVGLARALVLKPDLLVADEPVSKLDVSVQAQILNRLTDLQSEYNLSMMFIAHDLSVVRHIADRVAVMYLGEIIEVAPVDELFENPQHPYTRSLLSAVPRIDPTAGGERVILEGSVPTPIDPPSGCRFHTRCPAVIPPEPWTHGQKLFKAAFTYRIVLGNEEVEIGSVKDRIEADDREASDDAIVQYMLEHTYSGDLEATPSGIVETLRSATERYVDGERGAATETLREAFPSPCVDEHPSMIEALDGHIAACHRVDPKAPGERGSDAWG
jgi:peptide/nickel transport system ATP-binding protein